MITTTVKPDCFEQAEHYNVNNGKCSQCYWGIECMYNFMTYLNQQVNATLKEANANV